MIIVYALVDPFSKAWRYIGKSVNGLKRPLSHSRPSTLAREHTHKANWIRSCLSRGSAPEILILEQVDDTDRLAEVEKEWIAQARACGVALTNATDGGDGNIGWVPSPETRLKISRALTGRPNGFGERMGQLHRGKPKSEERRLRMSLSAVGKPKSRDAVEKSAAKHRGRPNPLGIERMRSAVLGRKQSPEQVRKRVESTRKTKAANAL